jgi:ferredoxin
MIQPIINEHCQGHGRCYELYPDLFEPDEQAFGVVSSSMVDEDRAKDLKRAVTACPEGAISLLMAGSEPSGATR